MRRNKALVIVTSQIKHVCPYKGQDQPLALCYKRAQDIEERDFCYACDHVAVLKQKFGLRTFRRKVRISRCQHCQECESFHAPDAPYKSLRDTRCPGFQPDDDEGFVWVALDAACTDWMVINVVTGERSTLAKYKNDRRFAMPLVGAPGTVPSDWRDAMRVEAATFAAARRRPVAKKGDAKDEESTTVRVKSARRKKTP